MNLIDLSNDAKEKVSDYIAMRLTEIVFQGQKDNTAEDIMDIYDTIRRRI